MITGFRGASLPGERAREDGTRQRRKPMRRDHGSRLSERLRREQVQGNGTFLVRKKKGVRESALFWIPGGSFWSLTGAQNLAKGEKKRKRSWENVAIDERYTVAGDKKRNKGGGNLDLYKRQKKKKKKRTSRRQVYQDRRCLFESSKDRGGNYNFIKHHTPSCSTC